MRAHLNRIIVLFVSIGYFILALDIFAEHFRGLPYHRAMWIPIVFSSLAALSGVYIVIVFNKFTYFYFNILMIISSIIGLMGFYFHNNWRFEMLRGIFSGEGLFDISVFVSMTPIFAPLAFIAISILGLLIAYLEPWGFSPPPQK